VYTLDFHRFHAPFLEIDCCAQVDVRRGATPILHDKEFDPEPFDPRDIVKELRLRRTIASSISKTTSTSASTRRRNGTKRCRSHSPSRHASS
jgi:hypothetical protein